jgi:GTP-binding protein LepA
LWILRNATHGNHQERLEREFNMTVITTVQTFPILLTQKILKLHGKTILLTCRSLHRTAANVLMVRYEKRGQITNQTYLTTDRVELNFDMPLAEIVFDFLRPFENGFKGYASFDYAPIGMRTLT